MYRLFAVVLCSIGLSVLTGCSGTVCDVSPSITGQPSNQTVTIGQPAHFTVAAAGSAPLTYQWFDNGTAIAGATKSSYMTAPTTARDSGSTLTVQITNRIGNVTSKGASLTVAMQTTSNFRYVAPNGSDSGPGSIDQPYRTIEHCAATVGDGWTCFIRAGTYRETVSPKSGITIASYNFEPVIVDGADPVTGWSRYEGSIYKAHASLSTDDTNQVFVGSEMMTEARWPNGDALFDVNWARAQGGTDETHIQDSNLPRVDWTGAKIHLWSGSDPFGNQTGIITASASGKITIDTGQTGTCPVICPARNGYYYIFGTLNALDAEREWYYDPNSSTLYFMPAGKVDPNTMDVRAKRRQYAFDLRGKSGVTIKNISIFASTIVTDQVSSGNTLDNINAQYVSQFTMLPVSPDDPNGINFSILRVHAHDSGIVINGTGNTLKNSTIEYSAGAGISLEGTGNVVSNNLIREIDYVGSYDAGIDLDGDNNTVEHNTIYDIGRQAIYVQAVVNEDIGYNNLYSAMKLSRDGAEIYICCSQTASAFRIHHNWMHDTQPIISGTADANPLAGIMIDWGSYGFEVDQNVLWRNHLYSVLVDGITNSGVNGNNIHNNTVPDQDSGAKVRITQVSDCSSTRVVDNRMVASVLIDPNTQGCVVTNNESRAPGATEMTPITEVGCNFSGCASLGPSAIMDDGYVTPCPATANKLP